VTEVLGGAAEGSYDGLMVEAITGTFALTAHGPRKFSCDCVKKAIVPMTGHCRIRS
jgi:hypothetical protein